MPHSSGGGGGSHHSHSGSSHRSHSHGSSGSRNSSRVSRTPFYGCRRYVRHRPGYEPDYIYTNADLGKKNKLRYIFLLFYAPFLFALLSMLVHVINVPKRLPYAYIDKDVYVVDDCGIIRDENAVYDVLEQFQEKTNITPAIITIDQNMLRDNGYSSLERWAYDTYCEMFKDEFHWLIVYCDSNDEWYFEGMQGDYTDGILTVSKTDSFNKNLTKLLASEMPFEDAIVKAFDELNGKIMSVSFNLPVLFAFLMFLCFISAHCYFMVFHDPYRKYRKDYKLDEGYSFVGDINPYISNTTCLKKCSFCGVDIYNDSKVCPYCGEKVQ